METDSQELKFLRAQMLQLMADSYSMITQAIRQNITDKKFSLQFMAVHSLFPKMQYILAIGLTMYMMKACMAKPLAID